MAEKHSAENDTCHYCGWPLGDAFDSEDHACPRDNAPDPARIIPPAACACGHPSDDHDDEGACMHLCDCAWPIPPAETTKETR